MLPFFPLLFRWSRWLAVWARSSCWVWQRSSAERAKASAGRVCMSVYKHSAGVGWGCCPIRMNPSPTCWGSVAYNSSCGCTIWWQTGQRYWLGFSSCWTCDKKVLKTRENKLPGACRRKHEKWRIVSVGAWIRLCVFVIWRLAADNSWRRLPPRIQKWPCQRSLWSPFPGRACIAELVIGAARQSWVSCC